LSFDNKEIKTDNTMAYKPTNLGVSPLKIEMNNEQESWRQFKLRFGIATIGMKFCDTLRKDEVRDQGDEIQMNKGGSLLNAMGEEGIKIFYSFKIPVEDIKYDNLIARFDDYFARRENVIILRHRFLNCKQESEESMTEYIERVTTAGEQCRLQDLEAMLIQVIINNMRSDKLRNELLVTADLNLNKLKEVCTRHEGAERTEKELKRNTGEEYVARTHMPRSGQNFKQEGGSFRQTGSRSTNCYKCGGSNHWARDCKETEPTCFNCGFKGHISTQCKEPRRSQNNNRGGRRGGYGSGGRGKTEYQGTRRIEDDKRRGSEEDNFNLLGAVEEESL